LPQNDPDFEKVRCPYKRDAKDHLIIGVQIYENNIPDHQQSAGKKLRALRCMGYEVKERKGA
jgi:hypothetical protein